jgi:hypothetical protein
MIRIEGTTIIFSKNINYPITKIELTGFKNKTPSPKNSGKRAKQQHHTIKLL